MENEKILPVGESGIEVTALPITRTPVEPTTPAPQVTAPETILGIPSPKQQQWGVVISIVIIVLMVIIGAFYAWGQRIAQNQYPTEIAQ